MKATGVVRRIDDLGRVVIPKEIRRTLRIKEGDPLEIFTDKEGEVILKKYKETSLAQKAAQAPKQPATPPPPPQQQQQQQSQQHQSQQQNNGDDSNLPPPPQFNGNMEPIKQNGKTPIRQLADRMKNSRVGKSKVGRGALAVAKKAVKPIYDFDKSGKYNGKRLVRNIAKGAVGTAVGLTTAAVQAGLYLPSVKLIPA
jgi:AbrB family looped-hinge helix DNA binding protein